MGLLLKDELKREAKDFEGCISSTSSAQLITSSSCSSCLKTRFMTKIGQAKKFMIKLDIQTFNHLSLTTCLSSFLISAAYFADLLIPVEANLINIHAWASEQTCKSHQNQIDMTLHTLLKSTRVRSIKFKCHITSRS